MRTSPAIDVLLSRTRQRVLAATLLQPQRRWYQLELAQQLGVRVSSLQRELKLLTEAGILKQEQDGRRRYFQADAASPLFEDLARILAKTVGLADVLKKALEPLHEGIRLAFVYGSIAASAERSSSDVDLMVIGDLPLSEIAPVLRKLEPTLARPINPTMLTSDEFRRRLAKDDHFLTTVLNTRPLFILGGPHELAELTSNAAAKIASNEPSGTRRSARRR